LQRNRNAPNRAAPSDLRERKMNADIIIAEPRVIIALISRIEKIFMLLFLIISGVRAVPVSSCLGIMAATIRYCKGGYWRF
jgi:hypothetical protein